MIQPDILIKSKRKTLSLTVDDKGKLIVHAPQRMAFEEIFSFLQKKQDWIKQKKERVSAIYQSNRRLINNEQVLFLGKIYDIVRVQGIKDIRLEESSLCVPSSIKPEKLPLALKKWYMLLSEEVILDRLDYFAELMDLDFASVKIVNSKAKWGSCDSSYNLTFNFKMVMLPPNLIDYIIIHELAHLIELNHSHKFWEVVASIMPTYKKQREQLKQSGFLLNLYLK